MQISLSAHSLYFPVVGRPVPWSQTLKLRNHIRMMPNCVNALYICGGSSSVPSISSSTSRDFSMKRAIRWRLSKWEETVTKPVAQWKQSKRKGRKAHWRKCNSEIVIVIASCKVVCLVKKVHLSQGSRSWTLQWCNLRWHCFAQAVSKNYSKKWYSSSTTPGG